MVNQWEIYLCSLDPTLGSEQRGVRPVLVVSNNAVNHALPVSAILSISSMKENSKIYPAEIHLDENCFGLDKESVAMIQQIRTVAHERFIKRIGKIDDKGQQEYIKEALRSFFELSDCQAKCDSS